MDQVEFAEMAGTSRATISRVENGRTSLRSESIAAIEKELGMTIHQALQIASANTLSWAGEYLQLSQAERAVADEIFINTIRAIKGKIP